MFYKITYSFKDPNVFGIIIRYLLFETNTCVYISFIAIFVIHFISGLHMLVVFSGYSGFIEQ
jgi:hypothetical protein